MTTSPASFAEGTPEANLARSLEALRARIIACGRDPASVRVVAVTKGVNARLITAAANVGLTNFGENYAQELEVKHRDVPGELTWHFIGALQRNKLARICELCDVISSVSRESELSTIAARPRRPRLRVQVDYTGAAGRNGAAPERVGELVLAAREMGLKVDGLMTVAPTDTRAAEVAFTRLDELAGELGLLERSMGMSSDMDLALRHGSTELRIGTALFGERDPA